MKKSELLELLKPYDDRAEIDLFIDRGDGAPCGGPNRRQIMGGPITNVGWNTSRSAVSITSTDREPVTLGEVLQDCSQINGRNRAQCMRTLREGLTTINHEVLGSVPGDADIQVAALLGPDGTPVGALGLVWDTREVLVKLSVKLIGKV